MGQVELVRRGKKGLGTSLQAQALQAKRAGLFQYVQQNLLGDALAPECYCGAHRLQLCVLRIQAFDRASADQRPIEGTALCR